MITATNMTIMLLLWAHDIKKENQYFNDSNTLKLFQTNFSIRTLNVNVLRNILTFTYSRLKSQRGPQISCTLHSSAATIKPVTNYNFAADQCMEPIFFLISVVRHVCFYYSFFILPWSTHST